MPGSIDFRITCGQLPPNCDKGHGFVHDPNVAGVPEVKAQIRLMFRTGSNNQTVVATRTFQLTNTRTKAGIKSQFKALENLIRFKERDGENSTANRRCADMDNAIPALMGVPRPILEHVIFCHQEESNWPLGEKLLLKKRFDEIFGSSRYTKALEAIEKQRKEIVKEAKEKSHVLALIAKDRDAALELRKEHAKLSDLITNLVTQIQALDAMVDRKEAELLSIQKLETENRQQLIRIESIKSEISKLESSCSDGHSPSANECTERINVLQSQLQQLSSARGGYDEKIRSCKSQFESLIKERNEISNRLKSFKTSQLEASNLHDLVRLKHSELNDAVETCRSNGYLARSFAFNTDQPMVSIKEMETVLNGLVSSNESTLSFLSLELQQLEQERIACESSLSAHRSQLLKLETERHMIESKISSSSSEVQSIDEKLKAISATLGMDSGDMMNEQMVMERISTAVSGLDAQLRRVHVEKRALTSDSSLNDLKADVRDMISDSVSVVSLMHAEPDQVMAYLEERRTSAVLKLETVFSSLVCLGTQVQHSSSTATSEDVDSITEQLIGAKQSLLLFNNLKSKSISESKCQLCKQRIASVPEFESAMDRLTRKIPDLIASFEAKKENAMNGKTSSGEIITVMDELKRVHIPTLVEVNSLIARVQALMDVLAHLDHGNENVDPNKLPLLESQEQSLVSEKNKLLFTKEGFVSLVEKRVGLVTVIDDYQTELASLSSDLSQKRSEVDQLTHSLDSLKERSGQQQSLFQSKRMDLESSVNSMRNAFQVIFQIVSQIDGLKARMSGGTNTMMADLTALESRESEISNALPAVMNELSVTEDELKRLSDNEKNLNADLTVWRNKAELARLRTELTEASGGIASIAGVSQEKLTALNLESRRLRDDRSKLTGELTQIKNQSLDIEKKLSTASFVDVEEKHRQAFCSMESHNVLAKDVQRYHQALDRALMSYHSQKMGQINDLIRDLWGRIYKGTDIDYIAIRSDTESENGEEGASAKRSYNYRVVMVKGDVELEMRGRCSAGQKVIACLIIRLALAESFCLSCGILALDEPTTNLDHGNIGGLAQALAELIASRREQRNFQLIIITHDESFVNMLGNLRACDHFYRVSKNEYGYSTISRSNIHEIHTRAR